MLDSRNVSSIVIVTELSPAAVDGPVVGFAGVHLESSVLTSFKDSLFLLYLFYFVYGRKRKYEDSS